MCYMGILEVIDQFITSQFVGIVTDIVTIVIELSRNGIQAIHDYRKYNIIPATQTCFPFAIDNSNSRPHAHSITLRPFFIFLLSLFLIFYPTLSSANI